MDFDHQDQDAPSDGAQLDLAAISLVTLLDSGCVRVQEQATRAMARAMRGKLADENSVCV